MIIHDEAINCSSRSTRFELFPFYDIHFGKRNCAEAELLKVRAEILKREAMKDRVVRVILGGDINDVIKPGDFRYDINSLADWVFEGDATSVREKLNDICRAQVEHAAEYFDPISHLVIGSLEANHDVTTRKRYNVDTHKDFCRELGIMEMTDEAVVRFRFIRTTGKAKGIATIKLYLRHGYGGGRTPGAEPNKVARMMADGVASDCDICLTGHTHTFYESEPIPVLYVPNSGPLPQTFLTRYRFGANPGCWQMSHKVGPGSYESAACYSTKALMTMKIVIWPFWNTTRCGRTVSMPKIEIRKYPVI